jgi:hypothetical protein
MANWKTFTHEAPDMAAKVEARWRAHTHHVMATLRADGAPRVSGTEIVVTDDELYLGSMWQARKARDLLRDPRVAVHSNPRDETMTGGDAKLDALAVEVPEDDPAKLAIAEGAPPGPLHVFRLDLVDVVLTEVDHDANALFTHLWRPGAGIQTTKVD